jgi:hypothetical protein
MKQEPDEVKKAIKEANGFNLVSQSVKMLPKMNLSGQNDPIDHT